MAKPQRLPTMRGFSAAVAHLPPSPAFIQSGNLAIGLEGDGPDRRLVLSLRHADGTSLAVSLSDDAMGRFGDLIVETYGPMVVHQAVAVQGRVQ